MAARALAKAFAKFHSIIPIHILDRPSLPSLFRRQEAQGIAIRKYAGLTDIREQTWMRLQISLPCLPWFLLPFGYFSPLRLGDRRLAHEKTLQLHKVLGAL
ncbi:MAG: hypothetical protein WCP63_12555 [Cyanobium sp. ELA712]